jgi:hypothetical protein
MKHKNFKDKSFRDKAYIPPEANMRKEIGIFHEQEIKRNVF